MPMTVVSLYEKSERLEDDMTLTYLKEKAITLKQIYDKKNKIIEEVKSIKEAVEIIRNTKLKIGYLDWNKDHHYIIYPEKVEDYINYQKYGKIKQIKLECII